MEETILTQWKLTPPRAATKQKLQGGPAHEAWPPLKNLSERGQQRGFTASFYATAKGH
jgi:hypothetical protein